MVLEKRLIDLENRAVAALAGICPRITRRTAQFLSPGIGATLDVTAKVRSEEFGSAVLGLAIVEFWLTAAAKHQDSSLAQDWAQLTLGFARERLSASASSIPELSQIKRVDYVIVANNQAGDEWLHVYRAVQELTLQNRAGGAAIAAINTHTVTASNHGHQASATSDTMTLFVSSTLAVVGTAIPVAWANAQQDDVIELIDESGTVIASHTVAATGPGSVSFANNAAGTFGAQLTRSQSTILSSLTKAERVAQQGTTE